MKEEFYYKINQLVPPSEKGHDFGFTLDLDKKYAKIALEARIGKKAQKNLYKYAIDIVNRMGWEDKFYPTPTYTFYKDTAFLTSCSAPGDRCTLGILGSEWDYFTRDPDSFRGDLRYCTHNVDSTKQTYTLLSLWLFWADKLEVLKK